MQEFISILASEEPSMRQRARHEAIDARAWPDIERASPHVRVAGVMNKHTTRDMLALLVQDPDADVRAAVAMRRCAGESVLECLGSDPDERVRNRVANNASTPRHVLRRLLNDTSLVVRASAEAALNR